MGLSKNVFSKLYTLINTKAINTTYTTSMAMLLFLHIDEINMPMEATYNMLTA